MKATGDFGPAPAGVDLAENQQPQMLGAVITLMIIGTLAVILRIYTRAKSSQTNFGLDDFLIFASLVSLYLEIPRFQLLTYFLVLCLRYWYLCDN